MSQSTKMEFKQLVNFYYQRHRNILNLGEPSFEYNGFISTATMAGSGGFVKLRCVPAEYHIEVFVQTSEDQKRWSLADLMTIESVRIWMTHSRPNTSGKPRLEAEMEVAFCLLVEGLEGVPNFQWMYRDDA